MTTESKRNETAQALSELDLNKAEVKKCSYCGKCDAAKRCSKRHQKCLKKIFCDESCEKAAHRSPANPKAPNADAPNPKDEEKAKAEKKKAKKAAKASKNKSSSDQFWWNNSVYASW